MSLGGSMSARPTASAAARIASGVGRCPTRMSARRCCREHRPVGHAQQRHPRASCSARRRRATDRGDAGQREVAMPARHLVERAAGARRRQRRDDDLDQQLARLERGREEPGEEVAPPQSSARRRALHAGSVASSASITAGSSAAGSACARLPPIVPRLRIAACATNGIVSATSGASRATRALALERRGAGSSRRSARRRRRAAMKASSSTR